MRFILFLFLAFSINLSLAKQNQDSTANDIKYIQKFIHDLADENIRTDIILSEYIIVEEPNNELYDYLEASLEEVRINLLAKKLDDIEYIPYAKMPRKDIKDIDLENINSNKIYFLHYKKRQLLAIYLKNNKLASFTLVSKGNNKAHFVLY